MCFLSRHQQGTHQQIPIKNNTPNTRVHHAYVAVQCIPLPPPITTTSSSNKSIDAPQLAMGDSGDLQNVLQAITALYHHDDRNIKEQANRWLQAWQQTPAAWSTSDLYLHNDRNNMEADYFMAQTLKLKVGRCAVMPTSSPPVGTRVTSRCRPQVQRDFEELPTTAALQLRDSLLQLLVGFCQSSSPVRTQLCIALAACAAHLPAPTWGQQGVLGWLRDMLSQQPRAVALSCLLEMLVVIPQVGVCVAPAWRRFNHSMGCCLLFVTACLFCATKTKATHDCCCTTAHVLAATGSKQLPGCHSPRPPATTAR